MYSGYKTSLVRCFRLQKLSYQNLSDFCKWISAESPSQKNWNMEWARCKKVAEAFKRHDANVNIFDVALFPTESSLSGERMNRIVEAAEVLYGSRKLQEQSDVQQWQDHIIKWQNQS